MPEQLERRRVAWKRVERESKPGRLPDKDWKSMVSSIIWELLNKDSFPGVGPVRVIEAQLIYLYHTFYLRHIIPRFPIFLIDSRTPSPQTLHLNGVCQSSPGVRETLRTKFGGIDWCCNYGIQLLLSIVRYRLFIFGCWAADNVNTNLKITAMIPSFDPTP